MAFVFKKKTCSKSEFFTKVIESLEDAGWENISSNPSKDKYVMYSKGVNGDKELYIHVSNTYGLDRSDYNTDTTNYSNWAFNFPQKYTPGASGSDGTFEMGSGNNPYTDYWRFVYGVHDDVPPTTLITYWEYVDKNGFALMIKLPTNFNRGPMFFFCRESTEVYEEFTSNRLMTIGWTANNSPGNSAVGFSSTPESLGAAGKAYNSGVLSLSPQRNPNMDDTIFASTLYFGDQTYGTRAKLDVAKAFLYQEISGVGPNVITGDKIKIGSTEYTAFVPYNYGSSFNSNLRGILIEVDTY